MVEPCEHCTCGAELIEISALCEAGAERLRSGGHELWDQGAATIGRLITQEELGVPAARRALAAQRVSAVDMVSKTLGLLDRVDGMLTEALEEAKDIDCAVFREAGGKGCPRMARLDSAMDLLDTFIKPREN